MTNDFSTFIGLIQIALSAIQITLDHFIGAEKIEGNVIKSKEIREFGEAIKKFEFALEQTMTFISMTDKRKPNARLANLWKEASHELARFGHQVDFASLLFEKSLYWRNPDFFQKQNSKKRYRISLDHMLSQLRVLKSEQSKLEEKLIDKKGSN